jgi:hypothetical protein
MIPAGKMAGARKMPMVAGNAASRLLFLRNMKEPHGNPV